MICLDVFKLIQRPGGNVERFIEALTNQLADANAAIADTKADGLIYNEGRLQLKAGKNPIGNTVQITSSDVDLEDGTIRVVEF